uniref:Putative chromatin remodeling protein n=1 Tax=Ixodes ricinus TaxID=34613 RepID=A0A0K8REQ3_IXORI
MYMELMQKLLFPEVCFHEELTSTNTKLFLLCFIFASGAEPLLFARGLFHSHTLEIEPPNGAVLIVTCDHAALFWATTHAVLWVTPVTRP